jgi:hypothetical protein
MPEYWMISVRYAGGVGGNRHQNGPTVSVSESRSRNQLRNIRNWQRVWWAQFRKVIIATCHVRSGRNTFAVADADFFPAVEDGPTSFLTLLRSYFTDKLRILNPNKHTNQCHHEGLTPWHKQYRKLHQI